MPPPWDGEQTGHGDHETQPTARRTSNSRQWREAKRSAGA
jgi:hypothetical protein